LRRRRRLGTWAFHERVLANAERTRKLAEKAQAELDRRKQQRESA
jgi:hypothetical protein